MIKMVSCCSPCNGDMMKKNILIYNILHRLKYRFIRSYREECDMKVLLILGKFSKEKPKFDAKVIH